MDITITKNEIRNGLKKFKSVFFVYYLYRKGECVYIGTSKNIYKRLKEHKYLKIFESIRLLSFEDEFEAKNFERMEIFRMQPKENYFCRSHYRQPGCKHIKVNIKDKIKLLSIINR